MADGAKSPASVFDLKLLVDHLAFVDDLPSHSTGWVGFGGDDTLGGIFVEDSRICWVAARALKRRLSDLLKEYTHLSPAQMFDVVERCRRDGRHFGQTLVEEGRVSREHLRTALLKHSAESMVSLHYEPGPRWVERGRRGYQPQFTFTTGEILLAVSAIRWESHLALAREELASAIVPGITGFAFVLDAGSSSPIPLLQTSGDPYPARGLMAIGAWAWSAATGVCEPGDVPSFAVGLTAEGRGLGVWWRDQLLLAAEFQDRHGLAALVRRKAHP